MLGAERKKAAPFGKLMEIEAGRVYDIRDGSEGGGRGDVDMFLAEAVERVKANDVAKGLESRLSSESEGEE